MNIIHEALTLGTAPLPQHHGEQPLPPKVVAIKGQIKVLFVSFS